MPTRPSRPLTATPGDPPRDGGVWTVTRRPRRQFARALAGAVGLGAVLLAACADGLAPPGGERPARVGEAGVGGSSGLPGGEAYPNPPPPPLPEWEPYPGPGTATWTSVPGLEIATPTPTHRPSPVAPESALVVDGAGGRVYASGDVRGQALLQVFDGADGHLTRATALDPGEALLGLDRRRRLYVYRADQGVRLLDADTLEAVGRLPLPTPHPSDTLPAGFAIFPVPAFSPLLDARNGHVWTFDRLTARAWDPDTGRNLRSIDLPLPPEAGPIYEAALTPEDGLLYLAVVSGEGEVSDGGTRVIVLDPGSGRMVGDAPMNDQIVGWLSWGDGLLATSTIYKDLGDTVYLWRGGRLARRLTEAPGGYSAFDSRRNRLLQVPLEAWTFAADQPPELGEVTVVDAGTLGGLFRAALTARQAPSAYDPATDRFYARDPDGDRLTVIDAGALAPPPVPTDAPIDGARVRRLDAWRAGMETVGDPAIMLGYYPVTATPPGTGDAGGEHAVSRDGGLSWTVAGDLAPAYDQPCLAVSPAFVRDQTLFRCGDGVGRSQDGGRSWQPANTGLQARNVQGLAISPGFERDRTLFAASFTSQRSTPPAQAASPDRFRPPTGPGDAPSAWRSRDAGRTWEALGPFYALALSPTFERDHTVYAFDHLGARCYVSADAGTTWQARGRLPELGHEAFYATMTWVVPATAEADPVLLTLATSGSMMGGAAHWPESGARLFRSLDEGATWDVAWQAAESPEFLRTTGGTLLGPVADEEAPDRANWLLHLGAYPDVGTLFSSDGGVHWSERHLPGLPYATPLTAWADGRILVSTGRDGSQRLVAIRDFEYGPPPTEPPRPSP